MNQTEYNLLSKEDIFKMYENVCEELELTEERSRDYQDELRDTERERDDAYDEISGLMEEIETLKDALDNKDCC